MSSSFRRRSGSSVPVKLLRTRRSGLKGDRSGMAASSASTSSASAPPDHAANAFSAASWTFARDEAGGG